MRIHIATAALALTGLMGLATAGGSAPTPQEVFDKLKSFEGRWEGHAMTADGPPAAVEYRVTSAGNTVMEVMFPGSEHEMISMYFLNDGELVAKHYCSSGNQPEYAYERESSTDKKLAFEFTGGTNLDPAKDPHMHGGTMTMTDDGELHNAWDFYVGGEKAEANRFFLTRK